MLTALLKKKQPSRVVQIVEMAFLSQNRAKLQTQTAISTAATGELLVPGPWRIISKTIITGTVYIIINWTTCRGSVPGAPAIPMSGLASRDRDRETTLTLTTPSLPSSGSVSTIGSPSSLSEAAPTILQKQNGVWGTWKSSAQPAEKNTKRETAEI